jgi:PPM family protein phosphatase
MELTFAAATDVGRQRDHNEDNFLVDKKLQLFIVADGMGGHAAGEVASSITVHQLRDAVYANRDLLDRFQSSSSDVQGVEILQMLEHAVQAACGAVYERAQSENDKRGMGTTVSVLLIVNGPENPHGFIAHVGDSRIYLTRSQQAHQLTEDHSLMNELIKRGKIKPGEIDNSPYKQFKNAVTRAVGVYASVEVDTFDFDIFPGDHFLLCSDGMYAYLDDRDLPRLLSEGDIRSAPKRLIQIANEGGGHDNITSIVLRVGDDSPSQTADSRVADLSLKMEVLKAMPLFRYLSYKELVRVLNITQTVEFDTGDVVMQEGQPGETMYVVIDGSVRVHKNDLTIATLDKGQHVGEMALVDRSPRSLSATAEEPSRLLAIRRKEFYEIIKKEPGLAVKLLWSFVQVLTDRLRKTNADLDLARTARQVRNGVEPERPDPDDMPTQVDQAAALSQSLAALHDELGVPGSLSFQPRDTLPHTAIADEEETAPADDDFVDESITVERARDPADDDGADA